MSKQSRMKKWRAKQAAGVEVICGICEEPISRGGDKGKGVLTADHIIPKSLGGTSENSNLQPAHAHCNRNRQNTILHEFKGHLKDQQYVRRAIEIIETHEEATLTLPQRLLRAFRQLRRSQNATTEGIGKKQ